MVVLVLTRLGNIFRPSIKGGARIGTVKVDRVCEFSIIDEANHGLGISRDDKSWTGRDAIVSNKMSRLRQVWVNLLLIWLDINLVVVYFFSRNRTRDFSGTYGKWMRL